MLVFSNDQVNEMLDILKVQHFFYIYYNISPHTLTKDELKLLKKSGIDIDIFKGFTPFEQAFYFGRLSAALKNYGEKVDYNNFLKYLERGQYIPLSKVEQNTLDFLSYRSTDVIRSLLDTAVKDVQGLLIDRTNSYSEVFRGLIREGIKDIIGHGKSKKDLMSELGRLTDKWNINIERIVETEFQNSFQFGRLCTYAKQYKDDEIWVYKDVFPGACKSCRELYTVDGVTPRYFRMSELLANGTNIGVKQANWKATVGVVHPHCRCLLRVKNEQVADYIEEAKKIKGKIKIKVGDVEYEI